MKAILLAIALAVVLSHPSITIQEDGKAKTIYIPGGGISAAGSDEFHVSYNGRGYFAEKDAGGYDPNMFYAPNLLGGYIQYDVDLSAHVCSCNAAFYLVSMPGYNGGQQPDPSQGGDYYCDANCVGGVWCPEMDIMEANKYAFVVTPHTCDSPSGKHYNHCDQGGCGYHFHAVESYGPGKRIDSGQKFTVKTEFIKSGSDLTEIKTTMSQGSTVVTHSRHANDCGGGYMAQMGRDVKNGMTAAISSWGTNYGGMSWLDGDTGCSGDCWGNPTQKVSNIVVKTGGSSPGPDPPTPGNYACSDGGCGSGSGSYDSFSSCLSTCTSNYDFGGSCSGAQTLCPSECGAGKCKWSWPRDDPAKWASHDANCRCQA